MSRVMQKTSRLDRPGWIPPEITHDWDTDPYAYQTEEELMPGGGLHGQLLAYLMELLRATLKARGLMLLWDTFMLYRDKHGVKQRIAPDLLLMPFGFPPPSAYDLDVEPPPSCVVEVTSIKSHFWDLQQQVPFYLGLDIPFYLVIDAVTTRGQLRKQIELHGWQFVDGKPREVEAAIDGSLPVSAMGLRVRALGQRIMFSDEATDEQQFSFWRFHPVSSGGGAGSKLCSMNVIKAPQLSKHR
ncbi:MAG: Uma2 family endonuclease [Candidatus Competibacteraceae bacterium]